MCTYAQPTVDTEDPFSAAVESIEGRKIQAKNMNVRVAPKKALPDEASAEPSAVENLNILTGACLLVADCMGTGVSVLFLS